MARRSQDMEPRSPSEGALTLQLRVQQEIARLARTLLALDVSEIDEAIRSSLETLAKLAGSDHCLFVYRDPQLSERVWFAAWDGLDMDVVSPELRGSIFPWSADRLRQGEVLHVPDLASLPEEAAAERQALEARGTQSMLGLPARLGPDSMGILIFERCRRAEGWPEEEITSLALITEILGSALKRRRIEDALRESEERFRTIAEQATELVAEFDARGRYLYVSPSYEALLGYAPQELIGQSADRLIHPADSVGSITKFVRAFEQDVPSYSLHRLQRKDGEWRWFENSGRAYRSRDGRHRFVSIGHDVTERIEAQHALERQVDLERRVAVLSRRLLGLTGEELGAEIQSALEDAARLTGADRAFLARMPDEMNGRIRVDEWHSERAGPWARVENPSWSLDRLLAGEIIHIGTLDDLPNAGASERNALKARGSHALLAIPLHTGRGMAAVFGFECCEPRTWRDHEITLLRLIGECLMSAQRRKLTEDALRESQLQLSQSQKLEAVGRLAGGIAHDFNNLLTVILGLSRPLLKDLPPDSETYSDMQDIHGAAERAAALTRQLLLFSRRQPIEERSVDLNATLVELRPLLSRMLGEDIVLEYALEAGDAFVRGDPHQFEQVVVNLAANGRDAMPRGGRLCISTRLREPDAQQLARLRLESPGRFVVLGVADSGEGMDEGTRRQIFDPFYTTKDPGKGTGLGLSIVYSVVEQSSGSIDVESSPGEGTRFALWLPAVDPDADEPPTAQSDMRAQGSERILFVEDEAAVRRLGRRILERAGYEVIEAADGNEALALVEADDRPVDAVVTDVVMPNLGGGELARRLRERHPSLPVLFVSGHPEDRGGALDLPDAELLHKPFTAHLLLQRLRQLLDR